MSLKKQEENLYYLLNSHKEEINHDSKRIRDLAKYTMLILEHKQVEFIDKLIKNEKIDKIVEKEFLSKAIEGLIKA